MMNLLALCLSGVVLLLPSCQVGTLQNDKGLSMGEQKAALKKYHARRQVAASGEPRGDEAVKKRKKPIFVVQKHAASHLHYDFRLEIGGVLKSWAVPKGPSMNSKDKRLAVPTDDHPLAYADFEGVIPEGNYGAGAVMIWDRGTFDSVREKDGKPVPLATCLREGRLEVLLHGTKLQGAFALIRTGTPQGENERWLLIKMRDMYAQLTGDVLQDKPNSAASGKSLEWIAKQGKTYADD